MMMTRWTVRRHYLEEGSAHAGNGTTLVSYILFFFILSYFRLEDSPQMRVGSGGHLDDFGWIFGINLA
jgi:hypothetical protein